VLRTHGCLGPVATAVMIFESLVEVLRFSSLPAFVFNASARCAGVCFKVTSWRDPRSRERGLSDRANVSSAASSALRAVQGQLSRVFDLMLHVMQ